MMSTRLRGVAEPLERAAELQQLCALLAAAGSGRGQACVIEGPSGVGKSRLLDECAASAEALGMSVLRTRCSELTRDYPFGNARNLFEAILVRADAETRAKLMRGPAALAEPVFGNGEAADEFGVLHGLYWLTVNLAEQRPMAILVDDLPWADDFSLRFFAYLGVQDIGAPCSNPRGAAAQSPDVLPSVCTQAAGWQPDPQRGCRPSNSRNTRRRYVVR